MWFRGDNKFIKALRRQTVQIINNNIMSHIPTDTEQPITTTLCSHKSTRMYLHTCNVIGVSIYYTMFYFQNEFAFKRVV